MDENHKEYYAYLYEENIALQMLMQLDPSGIGSAVDTYVKKKIADFRYEREKIFFDDLKKSQFKFDQELIESNNFLHCFFITTDAVKRTNRKEKIHLYANLFINGIRNGEYESRNSESDEYEYFLSILNDMTYLEIELLEILFSFENKINIRSKEEGDEIQYNKLQRAQKFLNDFEKEAASNLLIEKDILRGVLTRLNRSGLFENIAGVVWDYTGGLGNTTDLYQKFRKWVIIRNE